MYQQLPGVRGTRKGGLTDIALENFSIAKYVLYLNCGGGRMYTFIKTHQAHLKKVNFIACKLYLNQPDLNTHTHAHTHTLSLALFHSQKLRYIIGVMIRVETMQLLEEKTENILGSE